MKQYKPYYEMAIIKRSYLVLKIGNLYWYKVDMLNKRGVNMVLHYPIQKKLGGLKRINNKTFYGRYRMIWPKR